MSNLTLELVEGPGSGRQVALIGPLEVGRDLQTGLPLEDGLVSRRHARITPDQGGAIAEDLGSRNGTFVNGSEIYAPTRIMPGDQILVGITVLELRSEAQVRAQPTAVKPVPAFAAQPDPAFAAQPDAALAAPADSVAAPPAEPAAAQEPQAGRAERPPSELDPLLDTYTKAKAKTAVLALFVLVVFVVLIFLATR
jgi:pSer/pThr/pTyr-binding forkhead associated (FHA) protein